MKRLLPDGVSRVRHRHGKLIVERRCRFLEADAVGGERCGELWADP